MKVRRAIVTGATGYIGSNIVKYLCSHDVQVGIICRDTSSMKLLEPVNNLVTIFRDIQDASAMTNYITGFQPDVVFHLASCFVSEHKPDQINDIIDSNIKFPTHLLDAMSVAGVRRFVNASTAWQNYNDEEYNPVCLYAASKESFEDILKYYSEVKGIDAISLAIFDSYGPGDPREKLIHLMQKIAKTGETLNMSGGEQELDMIYIDDIVSDFIYAAELLMEGHEHENKYYIRSGQIVTLKELVHIFEHVYDTRLHINWGARPYRAREVMKLARRGHAINPDAKRISLEEGLERIRAYERGKII